MEKYKPVMSFDEDAAEVYDDGAQRGDEMATVAFLEQLARGGVPHWNLRSAPGGSRYP